MSPQLLEKFFDGKCNPEEVHQILIWINSQEGADELLEDFENFEQLEEDIYRGGLDLLAKIHLKIEEEESLMPYYQKTNENYTRERTSAKGRPVKWKIGVAVSVVLTILFCSFWIFSLYQEEKNPQLAENEVPEFIVRETKVGEKLKLKLSDGSIILLHSNSKIRFPKSFSPFSREVYLKGEAFFDVQRDEAKPFIVHSRDLITSVLGTSFSIKEDTDGEFSQVAVLTGRVKINNSSDLGNNGVNELILEPMNAANFNSGIGEMIKVKIDYDQVFAWKDNVIVFQNVGFQDVINRLENWYGIRFIVNKPIQGAKDYTGRFEDQTLEEVLLGLSFTFDFRFKIEESVISIY